MMGPEGFSEMGEWLAALRVLQPIGAAASPAEPFLSPAHALWADELRCSRASRKQATKAAPKVLKKAKLEGPYRDRLGRLISVVKTTPWDELNDSVALGKFDEDVTKCTNSNNSRWKSWRNNSPMPPLPLTMDKIEVGGCSPQRAKIPFGKSDDIGG